MEFIAELCQNHNGDFGLVEEMVAAAAESGAAYVKIQTIFADRLTKRDRFENGLTDEGGAVKTIKRPYGPEFERLKGLELSMAQHEQFIEICQRHKVKPLTTCFATADVERLAKLPWSHIKVASYDCGSLPMLRKLAENFEHLIISTGATFDEEIAATSEMLRSMGTAFSLLHCVTIYPTPLNELHLGRLDFLKQYCDQVGFSDHSLVSRDGVLASLAAIYLGATVIERHFTILEADQTRDGPVSVKPVHVKELVDFAALSREEQLSYLQMRGLDLESVMGDATRPLSPPEMLNRDYYRGRFASPLEGGGYLYNWEEAAV